MRGENAYRLSDYNREQDPWGFHELLVYRGKDSHPLSRLLLISLRNITVILFLSCPSHCRDVCLRF